MPFIILEIIFSLQVEMCSYTCQLLLLIIRKMEMESIEWEFFITFYCVFVSGYYISLKSAPSHYFFHNWFLFVVLLPLFVVFYFCVFINYQVLCVYLALFCFLSFLCISFVFRPLGIACFFQQCVKFVYYYACILYVNCQVCVL